MLTAADRRVKHDQLRIVPRGPYSLRSSADFLCGFTPAAGSSCSSGDGRLVLGFLEEARHVPVTVALDHDARGLCDVARRDPAIRTLLDAAPGFRPVCFPLPYEAAIWGVLAQRITITVAAKIKQRLAIETATLAEGFGRTFHPSPALERSRRSKASSMQRGSRRCRAPTRSASCNGSAVSVLGPQSTFSCAGAA